MTRKIKVIIGECEGKRLRYNVDIHTHRPNITCRKGCYQRCKYKRMSQRGARVKAEEANRA